MHSAPHSLPLYSQESQGHSLQVLFSQISLSSSCVCPFMHVITSSPPYITYPRRECHFIKQINETREFHPNILLLFIIYACEFTIYTYIKIREYGVNKIFPFRTRKNVATSVTTFFPLDVTRHHCNTLLRRCHMGNHRRHLGLSKDLQPVLPKDLCYNLWQRLFVQPHFS